ncbi:hypothetical protein H696_04438 [Fonticula alba]|uniref:V-SNARE coiled-coil homology domain-containing protein n=1 Tax=Fonticula alba TaxID=691883 RepID=A0A058Z534_FONAL|nr:hypothetical protein H696_04438 [Fonticula alba]KCV69018.1 hypothetical protein H696_04438 [Fonticula alba]|eukprot:XP_009496589.1 hypothetical protein H696_04438 [Fonticula alba]
MRITRSCRASPYNSNAPYGSTSHGGNDYYGSGQPDKLPQPQSQVDEVVSIMHQNLGKVMERGERLDDLQERTDQLQNQANQFRTGATKIRKQFWWKNVKLNLIIAGIVILLLIIIIA